MSKCSSAISKPDIGFYVLPASLCLSLIESNLERDRSQGVAALGPPSCGARSVQLGVPRPQDKLWMVGDEAGKVN